MSPVKKKRKSQMSENDFFTTLPIDVVFQILAKLPAKSLIHLRLVSKHFKPLISHSHFLKLHLSAAAAADSHRFVHYVSTDYTKLYFSFHAGKTLSLCKNLEIPFKSVHGHLRIVGSSKGIICLFDTSYFTFVGFLILWNPFIGMFKILDFPKQFERLFTNSTHMVVGFAFDHTVLDFKVIKILYDSDFHEFPPKALIYRFETTSWSRIDQEIPCFMPMTWNASVLVNDVVHWLACKWEKVNDVHPNCIMGFDVVEEMFSSMELPHNLAQNVKEIRLSQLGERKSLALFVSYHDNVGEKWDVWFMSDYGNAESWMKNCVVVFDQIFFPLKILNDDEVLAATSDEKLVLIDMENGGFSVLEVRGLPFSFYAGGYMPTLAMLDRSATSGARKIGSKEAF